MHEYSCDGDLLISEEFGDKLLIFIYDETGSPIGFKYRTTSYAAGTFDSYIFAKNILGDITAIYNTSGTAVATYTYDAWGKIISTGGTLASTIGAYNPFRYRGYYYDTDTGFYYLQSRYYDPEICRFINADDISYLGADGELTGYNLYSYCGNNPVMYIDPTGHVPEWLKWVAVGVGAALTIAAITVLICGVGTATLTGAVMVGASKGTLIGAAVGVIGGGAIGYAIDGKDGMFTGAALGFGGGAVIGAISGGFAGANGWYNAKALEFTNIGSQEVVLGRSPGYVELAKSRGATYFHTTDNIWNATKAMRGVGNKGMWKINRAFLKQQIKAGAHFTLANPPSGFFYAKEVAYVMRHGIYAFL